MKADKQSPPSGGSGMPKDMVSTCLLKRQNFLSVTIQITFDAVDCIYKLVLVLELKSIYT
jgi:hypothetical protein